MNSSRAAFVFWGLLQCSLLFFNNYFPSPVCSILLWGFMGGFAAAVGWRWYKSRRPLLAEGRLFWTALVGWLAWGVVASWFSPEKIFSIREVIRYGIGAGLLFVYIQWLQDDTWLAMVIRALWVFLIVYTLLMIAKIYFPGSMLLGDKWHTNAESGSYLAAFLPVFLGMIRRMRGIAWMNWAGAAILLAGVVSTDSSAALLAVLVSVLVLLCFRFPVVCRRVLFLGAGALAGLFTLCFIYVRDFSGMLLAQLSGRERIWSAALEAIAGHPVWGVGPGRWFQWFTAEYRTADFIFDDKDGNIFYLDLSRLSGQAHNLFLTKAAEMGIPSLLLLLCVFAAWLWQALYVCRALPDGWRRDLARGCAASFSGLAAFCLFENGPIIGVAREGELVLIMIVLAIPLAFMGMLAKGAAHAGT